jgi:ATP-dependent RNA helicase DeaD
MGRLRSNTADLLVATDVAARGLDVDHVHPRRELRRSPRPPRPTCIASGRVGRAGREGVAITLAEPRERRQISNIERVARRKLSPEKVPTVADLRAAQNEQILGSLREALEADDSARFLPAVEALAGEFELADVAAAALKLAHDATSGSAVDDQEIPDAADRPRRDRGDRDRPDRDRGPRDRDRGPRPDRDRGDRGGRDRDRSRGGDGDVDKLFINVGKMDSVRPGDLVGAITGESRLQGRDIGAIQIFEKFSLVEVPAGSAEDVIRAMRNTTIRGRKASIRRDRGRND